MARRDGIHSRPARNVTIEVTLAGRKYLFDLCQRPLSLGDAGEIQYYWMDSSLFRKGLRASDAEALNLRHCIGLWWRAAKAKGANHEPAQIKHLLLASCYGLFANDKALQDVYHDAFLRARRGVRGLSHNSSEPCKTAPLLPEYDRAAVMDFLNAYFRESVITQEEAGLIHGVAEAILTDGLRGFQIEKASGALDFVRRIDAWAAKIRRRGGQPFQRTLLNHFEYAAKLSFYRCYGNTWIHILAALEQQGLDDLSSRFLRFWHWQNQPAENADGTLEPDVFCGQILALHPLSGVFMQDPQLLAIAGSFFAGISASDIG